MKQVLCLCVLIGLACTTTASDIIEVIPLTNKILLVHFDDGYIQRHVSGQRRSDDIVFESPLSVTNASLLNSYQLTSIDDPDFISPAIPIDISRKSKGTEFAMYCDAWTGTSCINNRPDHVKEHWIYLYFATGLKTGKQYILTTANLAANSNSFSFVYNEAVQRSEAVHVNQVGYAPNAPLKAGYLYQWMGSKGSLDLSAYAGKNFHLVNNNTNQIAFTGTVGFRKAADNNEYAYVDVCINGSMIGAEVYECNFSAFCTPGTYRIYVDGMGCSYPFDIGASVYTQPFELVTKHIYHHRSGIALQPPYTTFTRPAPHNPNTTPGFAGRLKYTSTRYFTLSNSDASSADIPLLEAGLKGPVNAWGWYQDAGDWDAYFTHSRVPAYLLFTFENGAGSFTDGELNIPESGNGIPDILDEARWLIRFHHRLKYELLSKNFGTGGVGGGRIAGDWYGGDEKPDGSTASSFQDNHRDWIITGEDPHMTYFYAALAAHYAYCLQLINKTDPENINWQQEAISAFNWAKNNTTPVEETTEKHGLNIKHLRQYAAAALYKLTGLPEYNNQFTTDVTAYLDSKQELSGDNRWGIYTYATLLSGANPALRTRLDSTIKASADFLIFWTAERRAMRWVGNYWQNMVTGQPSTPMIFELIMAYHRTKNTEPVKAAEYLKYIYTTCDYFLGNNPQNMTWVTGLGEKSPKGIFHMDSWYSGADPWPGNVPYGPWKISGQNDQGNGPWQQQWAYKTIYPEGIYNWPGHEQWFSQRTVPLGNENTIHENQAPAAAAYGFLKTNPAIGSVACLAALPLQLISFDADKIREEVRLHWTVSEEETGVVYIVERSYNGVDFSSIHEKINSSSRSVWKKYEYLDKPATSSGTVFYRLKIQENNRLQYSPVRTIEWTENNQIMLVYPNPFHKSLTVRINNSSIEKNGSLALHDFSGRLVEHQLLIPGKSHYTLGEKLAPGTYLLKFQANGKNYNYKIIKQ
jgi:endoglucanase